MIPSVEEHRDDGAGGAAPMLVWRFAEPVRCIASTVLGGGIGDRCWVINATVTLGYREQDPAGHAARIASERGLEAGLGAALLTGVDVRTFHTGADDGALATATVGLGALTWAAAPDGQYEQWRPGTVNVVAAVPEPLHDAALVNLVATITEAKVQAFRDSGVPATGTPSDAVVVWCPAGPAPDDDRHRYGGPRSWWGARVARAAHAAITEGIAVDRARPR